MKEFSVQGLSKTYGDKVLFDDVDLSIFTGDRIGLIGPNGTGKSSFLEVIAGRSTYDGGEFIHPNVYTISYLPQTLDMDLDMSVIDFVYQSNSPLMQLVSKYQRLTKELEKDPENQSLLDKFFLLNDEMNKENAWDVEVKARSILTKLGIVDMDKKLTECSGGMQKRIALARVLIEEADLLILDEPTNHLDIEAITWLENYLKSYLGAILLVTHDRYFLDNVTNRIVELRNGKLNYYTGNYEAYLEQARIEAENKLKQEAKEDSLYKEELAWMKRGARARTTKQEARIQRFEELQDNIKQRTREQELADFSFEQDRIGKQIIELEEVELEISGTTFLKPFTKTFIKGDRLGIVGKNGVGKSTLLNAIAGLTDFTNGSYTVGQTVNIAYYRQLDEDLPDEERILSYINEIADQFKSDNSNISAAQLLERFNFPRSRHGNLIKSLSGGERRRLYLVSLLVRQPNVLLLDEPTNDLDLDTLGKLEAYLDEFQGVVIVVSHDRYFLDRVCDQLLVLKGNGDYEYFWGTYSAYQEELAKEEAPPVVKKAKDTRVKKAKKLNYQEQKEWDSIEENIMSLEEEIEQIKEKMYEKDISVDDLMNLQKSLEEKDEELLNMYERYEYLSEKLEEE